MKLDRMIFSAGGALLFCLASSSSLQAQGPRLEFFFHPATELNWAECHLESRAGSRQRVPFLPVITTGAARAPLGTFDYTRDIDITAPIVFAGNGIVLEGGHDSYHGRRDDWTVGSIDMTGKAVLLSPDFPDAVQENVGKDYALRRRIEEAARRGAAAVVLFTAKEGFPFLTVGYAPGAEAPRIPVITITRATASAILDAAGLDPAELFASWTEKRTPPESRDLIARLHLRIEGAFQRSETTNFLFRYRAKELDRAEMDRIAEVNERALTRILDLFKGAGDLRWTKLPAVYFSDYDSKLFYTHHWGSGLASDEGMFMVHRGGVPSLGLAAHENAHILGTRNWGGTTSFLNEGFGRYAEAMVTDPDLNDRQTAEFLRDGKLFPLEELLTHNIGRPGLKTQVGYPAAGSFVGYLIRTYGLAAFKKVWQLEAREDKEKAKADSWTAAFGRPLSELEAAWRAFLSGTRDSVDRTFSFSRTGKNIPGR
jgi:hypothetical protein